MNLKDKVVVVTGASSGIGRELAFQFSEKGGRVVLAARNASSLKEAADYIQSKGCPALAVKTDVTKRSQVESLMQKTVDEFGRIDILVNNAGVSTSSGDFMDNTEEEVRRTWETNFMGTVYGIWSAFPWMVRAGGGEIVIVSSIAGKRGFPGSAAYSASKFALQGLAESLRLELAPHKIKVILVSPSNVDTPFFKNNKRDGRPPRHLHPLKATANCIVEACENEKSDVMPTFDVKGIRMVNALFPSLVDRLLSKISS